MDTVDFAGRIRDAFAVRGHSLDHDVLEELTQHARAMYDAARADGATPADALRRVDLQITVWQGDATLLRRRRRETPVIEPPPAVASSWFAGLGSDLRYAARLLHRRAGFTILIVSTMALGVAATTTLFSVVNAVLFTRPPWHEAERLVLVREARGGHKPRFGDISNAAYLAWREAPASIDGIAAWTESTVTISGQGDAQRVQIASVTPDLFPLLGVQPLLGRAFAGTDLQDGRQDLLVLSESLWRTRFNADVAAIGRAVQIDGKTHTIVGVLPDRLAYPDAQTAGWTLLDVPPGGATSMTMLNALAKLRHGVSPAQAAGEATARTRATPPPIDMLMTAMFGGTGPADITLTPLHDARTASTRPVLLLLLGAVALLFVTATANVASLFLARATTRMREIAIRSAIGAGAGRVVRQLLAESVLLTTVGGAIGLLLAWVLGRALPSILSPELVGARQIAIDGRVVLFTVTISLVAGVATGLLPALRAGRLNLVDALGQDGAGSVGANARTATMRMVIMSGQVAAACVLLVGGALLARSFSALVNADRGYEPSHLLTAWIPMPAPAFTPEQRARIAAGIVERLGAAPGVSAVGLSNAPPAGRGRATAFTLDDRTVQADARTVTTGFFNSMGLRVVAGRTFTEDDARSQRPMIVVNETFARQYLDGPAAGRHVRTGLFRGASSTEVVGVVADVRHRPEVAGAEPQVYLLAQDRPSTLDWSGLSILARTSDDPVALIPTLRGILREQSDALPVDSIMTMEERLRAGLRGARLTAMLVAAFATCALLIAAAGLFGVLTYSVTLRSREIAVRAALGARPGQIALLVLRQAFAVVLVGVAVGLPAALVIARSTGASLYGVTARDPWSYAFAPIVLALVALAACAGAARRAWRLDPLTVLKNS